MRILVQKFGGTSVADIDRLKMVRGKVKAALDQAAEHSKHPHKER